MAAPTRVQELTKIAQGREAEIFAWEGGTVLRLPFRDGSAEAVERETAAIIAAATGGLRVPEYHGSVTIGGRIGQVLERLDGPDLLTDAGSHPWKLRGLSSQLGRLQATMHDIKAPEGMRSLRAELRAATVDTVRGIQRPYVDRIQPVLARLSDGDRLTHGDFHLGNVMMHRGEAAVIDWRAAAAAPPEADVARTLILMELGKLPDDTPWHARAMTAVGRGLARRWYFKAYRQQRPLDSDALEDWYTSQLFARLGFEITPRETEQFTTLLEERLD